MDTVSKKFIFVLMPFDESFDDTYQLGIKKTCNDLGLYCERVDEQIFKESILDRIYNQITKADLIIADMTGRNPNVFYEVGYAHGINKNVILLTQDVDDIPFDFKHFPHIVYGRKIIELKEQLNRKIDWFINTENKENLSDIDFNIEFLIEGEKITEGSIIDLRHFGVDFNGLSTIKLNVYNNSPKTYKTKFKIGLEVDSNNHFSIYNLEEIKPSTHKTLFMSKEIFNVYPNAYKSIDFQFSTPISNEKIEILIDCTLKIFTYFELKIINFKFKVLTQNELAF